ncbi:MAG: hypothetical protein ABJN26_15950 [Stappiaceae bacterium]
MLGTYCRDRAEVRVGKLQEPRFLFDTDAIVRVTLAGICGADPDVTRNGPEMGVPQCMRIKVDRTV